MRTLALILALLWPMSAFAQQSDRDYLTAFLEDSLSGAGRQVVITGFAGALSSQARMDQMTIADAAGVWITLSDVVLEWQRSDLLAGRITVNRLTAAKIDLDRLPEFGENVTAEAQPFALPELPVAVSIGEIGVQTLRLGAGVLGEEVTATGTASLQLAAGEGQGRLRIERLDLGAPSALIDLAASFANATRMLDLDLRLSEGKDGLFAKAMGIPEQPALDFTAQGAGPLSDFTADVSLATDGQPRITGRIATQGAGEGEGEAAQGSTRFDLDLSGDVAVLLQPDYRAFFGPDTRLQARGRSPAAGGFDVENLTLAAQSLHLTGQMAIGADGLPQRVSLQGTLQDAGSAPVVLPIALDSPATLTRANLLAEYDASKGADWRAEIGFENWDQTDLRIARGALSAVGTLQGGAAGTEFGAEVALNVEGLQPARAALSRALGSVLWGGGKLNWVEGKGPLRLTDFTLGGDSFQLGLNGSLDGLAAGLAFDGHVTAQAADLNRFAGLAQIPLGGAGEVAFDGRAEALTGAFDGSLVAKTRDLAFGIRAADTMLQGLSEMHLKAKRSASGIDIDRFTLAARGGGFDIAGQISGAKADVAGQFHLADLPLAERGFAGAVTGGLRLTGSFAQADLVIAAQGTGLDIGIPSLRQTLIAPLKLDAQISMDDLVPRLVQAALTSKTLSAQINQTIDGVRYDVSAKLVNLGLILPQFPGPVSGEGQIALGAEGADLGLNLSGPAGLRARIDGLASLGPRHNLRLSGRADAGLVNGLIAPRSLSGGVDFDLSLRGPAQLSALGGTIALQGGQMADPSLPFSLRDIAAQARLGGGTVALEVSAAPSSGGRIRVQGQMGSAKPFAADLTIELQKLGLRVSDLVDSQLSGRMHYAGAALGQGQLSGQIDLGPTEVQLRSTVLPTSNALPALRHKGAAPAVTQTRQRAGLDQPSPTDAQRAPIDLDITVRALNRVFVRGRGLDAELGGALRLKGTSIDVRPAGAFDLVQGRFEILTKRLTLEEVRLEMQGNLIPYLYVRASNVRGDVTSTVTISGPAIDPDIRFSSSPEMPEEEVLAQLLFDQNLTRLTGLQAVQLANAVAALSGRGEGILARTRKALKLDDLDIQTTTEGAAALKLGKYVSDNVYSEITAEGRAKQSLDFTYSLNEKIKLRAGAATTGNASVGIEFETNY